jgi:hypothetical protein
MQYQWSSRILKFLIQARTHVVLVINDDFCSYATTLLKRNGVFAYILLRLSGRVTLSDCVILTRPIYIYIYILFVRRM